MPGKSFGNTPDEELLLQLRMLFTALSLGGEILQSQPRTQDISPLWRPSTLANRETEFDD